MQAEGQRHGALAGVRDRIVRRQSIRRKAVAQVETEGEGVDLHTGVQLKLGAVLVRTDQLEGRIVHPSVQVGGGRWLVHRKGVIPSFEAKAPAAGAVGGQEQGRAIEIGIVGGFDGLEHGLSVPFQGGDVAAQLRVDLRPPGPLRKADAAQSRASRA